MARLREEYNKKYKKEIMKELGYKNPMQVPTLKKIVVNIGAGEVVSNHSALEEIVEMFRLITGQKPIVNKAKKAVSSFKIRQGQEIGVSVTLRGERMWEFFDKLVNVVFPRTKDFRGFKTKSFDGLSQRGQINITFEIGKGFSIVTTSDTLLCPSPFMCFL